MADVFKRGKKYYGKVKNPKTGEWKMVSLGVTDKGVARKLLREAQEREEKVAHGFIDPNAEVPLGEHLDAFLRHLRHQDRNENYIVQTETEIIKVALFAADRKIPARFDRKNMETYRALLAGITLDVLAVDALDRFLAGLPDRVSARTKNGYRTSVINLYNFLLHKRKVQFNPLLCVTKAQGEKKRKRRALDAAQLQRLFDAAAVRPLHNAATIHRGERKGQQGAKVDDERRERLIRNGRERSLLYRTAFYTGLRRGEMRALRVKHLYLEGDMPHFWLPGQFTKNGEDARLPIPSRLASLLRDWIAGNGADDPVFRMPKYDELLKAMKKDLKHAGIPYRDDHGRVFDFHSLRKSLGTHLRLGKVDPAVSQLLMRHGDIRLTMETYNDSDLHNLRSAVESLPTFAAPGAPSGSTA